MSIVTEGNESSYSRVLAGTPCFFCGQPIRAIAIFWQGCPPEGIERGMEGGELWLHPPCVVNLTIRLYRDVHEVQQKMGDLEASEH